MKIKTAIFKMKEAYKEWPPNTDWDEYWQEVRSILRQFYNEAKDLNVEIGDFEYGTHGIVFRPDPEGEWEVVRHLEDKEPEPECEYEVLMESENTPFEPGTWMPISTDAIKNPEKIPEYIKKGILRKIQK